MFDRAEIARAAALREAWEAGELRAFLDRQPESRTEYRTLSGVPLKRVYTAEDVKDLRQEDLGLPGQYPYTRGPYPTMYRGRLWTMRQIAGFGTGEDTNGYHISAARATSVQEVDFTMANAIAYVEEVTRAGVAVDEFAPRLAFYFVAQNDFFEEIAKFRAARRIYARIMKERFGARNPESMRLRFHCQTAAATLTRAQPMNNVVRTALQAL